MNSNNFIFFDFETGGKKAHVSQPIQLAAVAIDGRKLTYGPDDTFETLMRPVFDEEECEELGIEPLQDDALKVNRKTREELREAPSTKIAWDNFVQFVERYKTGNGKWDNPIPIGFNNNNFDDIIIKRLCREYGPYEEEYDSQAIFHPVHNQDLMKVVFRWTEDMKGWRSLKMDVLRDYFGMTTASPHLKGFAKGKELYAHDALRDVLDGAELFVRYQKLVRRVAHETKFRNVCK